MIGSSVLCARGSAPTFDDDEFVPVPGARAPPPPSPDGNVTEIARPPVAADITLAVTLEAGVPSASVEEWATWWRLVAAAAA